MIEVLTRIYNLYSPKWIDGLSLGLIRWVQMYSALVAENIGGLKETFLFSSVQKFI